MAGANKQGKVSEGSDDESIDLSAGFIPKPEAGEPPPEEMTPDSFIWRWVAEKDMPALERLHFQAEIKRV